MTTPSDVTLVKNAIHNPAEPRHFMRVVPAGEERTASVAGPVATGCEAEPEILTTADGVEFVRNTYDRWGRVETQLNEFGRESAYEYELDGTARIV